jgi:hypothetical protein
MYTKHFTIAFHLLQGIEGLCYEFDSVFISVMGYYRVGMIMNHAVILCTAIALILSGIIGFAQYHATSGWVHKYH